jgi:hypothetical protein
LDRISSNDYKPTDEDILMSSTTKNCGMNIFEIEIKTKKIQFIIPNQKNEQRKW